jgi:hypothetical protein
MCSLRYEHDFYVQSRKRFPKEGKILATSLGEEKVVANDIFRDRVTLRTAEGDVRVVELADLKREMAEVAGAPASADESQFAGTDGDAGGHLGGDAGPAAGDALPAVTDTLTAAALGDGEVPLSLAGDRPAAAPPRPLREPERRAATPAYGVAAVAGPDEGPGGTAVADAPAPGGAADGDDAEEGADETDGAGASAAGEEGRRPRRRRGRRGGRRGRGTGEGSNGGTTTGSPEGGE